MELLLVKYELILKDSPLKYQRLKARFYNHHEMQNLMHEQAERINVPNKNVISSTIV